VVVSDQVGFEPRTGEGWRDPTDYRVLRDHDPVHHVERGDYWVLSRFADIAAAARDPRHVLVGAGSHVPLRRRRRRRPRGRAADGVPRPAPTTPSSAVSCPGFTPRQVRDDRTRRRRFVTDRLDRLVADGGGDIVAALLKPLPTYVVAHYPRCPGGDPARFDGWVHDIVRRDRAPRPPLAPTAVAEVLEYFGDLIERAAGAGATTSSPIWSTRPRSSTPTARRASTRCASSGSRSR